MQMHMLVHTHTHTHTVSHTHTYVGLSRQQNLLSFDPGCVILQMSFPKYIDHDRIDDGGYVNYNGQENMAVGMWSGYSIPNDDYESSDCDAVPENEFSVEIQQMLNRSTTGAATTSYPLYDSEKSPRGPYDSPSEDEENDESVEFQPPNKLQKLVFLVVVVIGHYWTFCSRSKENQRHSLH